MLNKDDCVLLSAILTSFSVTVLGIVRSVVVAGSTKTKADITGSFAMRSSLTLVRRKEERGTLIRANLSQAEADLGITCACLTTLGGLFRSRESSRSGNSRMTNSQHKSGSWTWSNRLFHRAKPSRQDRTLTQVELGSVSSLVGRDLKQHVSQDDVTFVLPGWESKASATVYSGYSGTESTDGHGGEGISVAKSPPFKSGPVVSLVVPAAISVVKRFEVTSKAIR